MGFILTRKPYIQKPPSGVRPNLGHPLAKGLVAFVPFNEGVGHPHLYKKGLRTESSDPTKLQSNFSWVHTERGLRFRFTETDNTSWLYWLGMPAPGTGEFTVVGSFKYFSALRVAYSYISALQSYAPGFIALGDSDKKLYSYLGGFQLLDTATSLGDDIVMSSRRGGGVMENDAVINRSFIDGYEAANSTNITSTTFVLNAYNSTGGGSAKDAFLYDWIAWWDKKLPDSVIRELQYNPDAIWQIYTRPLPIFIPAAAGGDTYTGTAASNLPSFTQAASSTFAAPVYTGTSAQVLPSVTQAVSGTFVAPVYTGTAAQTLSAFTQSASGTFSTATFTGTAVSTLPSVNQAASGTFAAPVYTGASAQVLPAFTQVSTSAFVAPVYTGTAASVLASITQSATGLFATAVYSGTSAQVLPSVTQAASGTYSAGTKTGTAASTLPSFSQAATSTFVAPVYTGATAQILPFFSQAASGTVGAPQYDGVAASELPSFSQSATGTFQQAAAVVASILPSVSQSAQGTFAPGTSTGTTAQILPFFSQSATASITNETAPPAISTFNTKAQATFATKAQGTFSA